MLAHLIGDVDRGIPFVDRALVLNPNLAIAWLYQPAERMTRDCLRHFESGWSDSPAILVVIASTCMPTDSGRLGWGRFHSKRG